MFSELILAGALWHLRSEPCRWRVKWPNEANNTIFAHHVDSKTSLLNRPGFRMKSTSFSFFTGGPRTPWCSLMIIYWRKWQFHSLSAQLEASTWPLCSSVASLVQSTSVKRHHVKGSTGVSPAWASLSSLAVKEGFSESEAVRGIKPMSLVDPSIM